MMNQLHSSEYYSVGMFGHGIFDEWVDLDTLKQSNNFIINKELLHSTF